MASGTRMVPSAVTCQAHDHRRTIRPTTTSIGPEQCEYCDLHDELELQANPHELKHIIAKIKKAGKDKKYDCIMGISGGIDSSTLLFTAVKYWNLKPLVIHFDNHWNAPEAIHNMTQLVKLLGVDSITYTVNKEEYDRLNDAFLWAGVPDADIPNDIAMTKLMLTHLQELSKRSHR